MIDRKKVWFWVAVLVIALALLPFTARLTHAQDVKYWDSIRNSQYEWTCEKQDGTFISGHTRQDKAEVACSNRTLQDGIERTVRSGSYRIVRLLELPTEPPVEPPVEPPIEPPVEPPTEQPQVTFGPVTSITQYPNTISALAQDDFRWEITFVLNSVTGEQGLAGRDESGTDQEGHLSVWINNGQLRARHQPLSGSGESDSSLISAVPIVAGIQYVVIVSVERGVGWSLWLNGQLQDSGTRAWGTVGNDLPLTVAGMCTRCDDDAVPPEGPSRPIDGIVSMAIYDAPLAGPDGTVMLNWINPTTDTDDEPLPEGIPDRISIYIQPERRLVSHLDGESIAYEVTGLTDGEHCFAATAWNQDLESIDSNTVCKVVP